MNGLQPRKHRGTVTKEMLQRFFADGVHRPDGLLNAIFIALGEAERHGFYDCMAIFEKPEASNDNRL